MGFSGFNPREEIRRLAESERTIGGPKLSFAEQCAAFAALYDGAPNRVVRRAFGISAQTASKLAGCLEHDPDPYRREVVEVTTEDHRVEMIERVTSHDHNDRRNPARYRHYEPVAREFEALGADAFAARYLTPEIIDRLAAARKQTRGVKGGRRPYDPNELPLDADGDPDFEKMTDKQNMAWRKANPTRYRELFPSHFENGNNGFYG